MLLIIHNLPSNTRYADIKTLIKDKCGVTEIIVDNLVPDGASKKVTVGLADEGDAAILMKTIDGLYVGNQKLYVEDVRQKKKAEQPFRPGPVSKPYEREQYNQAPHTPFENQYYEQQNDMQFHPQPPLSRENQITPVPPPNFGVPFYMSAQNQNVGNKLQYMVQYPKIQGSVGNELYERRDMEFDQQYRGQKRDQPSSSDRGSYREHLPKRSSRWNESDNTRPEGRRGPDRPAQHDDRHNADKSYKDNTYRDSYQNRSNQDYRSKTQSNNNRFEKVFNRSESKWERPDRPKFQEQNESYHFSDNRNTNAQDHRYNQEREIPPPEPQRFRENNYSQSSDYNNESRPSDFPKKRPYESSPSTEFSPPSKKFGSIQQRNSINQQEASGSPFSKNYQNRKAYQQEASGSPFSKNYQNKKAYQQEASGGPFSKNYQNKKAYQQEASGSPFSKNYQNKKAYQQEASGSPFSKNYQNKNASYQQEASGSPFFKNYQNKKVSYSTKFQPPIRAPIQENRSHIQPKVQQKTKPQKKQINQKQANNKPTEEMLARHEAWRVQSAAVIATQIHNNMGKTRNKKDRMLPILKACVRARIDAIVGDDMSFTLKDMLSNYREKFHDDDAFYKTVCEKAAKGEVQEFKTAKKESEARAIKRIDDIKPKLQFIGKPAAAPSSDNAAKLPKYPDGNKKVLSQMKQAQKDEILNESLYTLDAEHEKSLKEELDKFDELIKHEYENPENETETSICKFMDDVFVSKLRKILTLNVRKRIMDVRTNLCVRVICQYKAPKRELLDAFLKDYGALSLKSSDRNRNTMIAICDTYENFDALCRQHSTEIDDLKIFFKPLHITGPPVKRRFKKLLNRVANRTTTENNNGNNIAATEENESGNNNEKDGNEDIHKITDEASTTDADSKVEAGDNEGSPIKKELAVDSDETAIPDVIEIMKEDIPESIKENVSGNNNEKDGNEDIHKITEKASTTNADSKLETGDNEGSPINKELAVDSDKATNPDDCEIMEDVTDLIDNDNIADDDLEDF